MILLAMRSIGCRIIPAIIAASTGTTAVANEPTVAVTTAAAEIQQPFALSIDALRASVSDANHALAARRLETEISRIQARGERGVLEPSFVASVERRRTERQNSIEQSLSQTAGQFNEDADSISGGVEGTLQWGTQYWVGTSLDKRTNNLTSLAVPQPFTSEYLTFSGIRITQPLLKGAGMDAVMARARVAEVEVRVKEQELRKETMELISRAELSYWQLTLFQHLLELREDSVAIAEKVLQDNRERVSAGKMSENEILEAEVGLAQRQSQRVEARQSMLAAADLLRAFLSELPDSEGMASLRATDEPVLRMLKSSFSESMGAAIRWHPDYLAQREIIEQERVRVRYMERQRWPQLDLVGSYGVNGIGDSTTNSYEMGRDADYEAWSIGVELRIPLGGGIREKADLKTAVRRKEQALLELKTAEVEIANALHTALKRVNSTRQQAGYYQRMVDSNRRLLESEIGLLDAGKSDSRRVLQIEQELVDAEIAYYQSLVEHQRAWLDWEVAEGSLLEHRDMEPTFASR